MRRFIYCLLGAASLLGASEARANVIAGEGTSGYVSTDDNYAHAVIGIGTPATGFTLEECWWVTGSVSPGCTALVSGINGFTPVGVSGFYSAIDHKRHAVIFATNGEIFDENYVPGGARNLDFEGQIPSNFGQPVSVASYATSDGFNHYVVGTNTGYLVQIRIPHGGGIAAALQIGPNLGNPVKSVSAYVYGSTECVSATTTVNSWEVHHASFNGVTSASTPLSVVYYEGTPSTPIAEKAVSDGPTYPTMSWLTASGDWGRDTYWTYDGGYIFAPNALEGTDGIDFNFGGTGESYGAFYESRVTTVHGIIALTSTTGGPNMVYDMRYDPALTRTPLVAQFLGTF